MDEDYFNIVDLVPISPCDLFSVLDLPLDSTFLHTEGLTMMDEGDGFMPQPLPEVVKNASTVGMHAEITSIESTPGTSGASTFDSSSVEVLDAPFSPDESVDKLIFIVSPEDFDGPPKTLTGMDEEPPQNPAGEVKDRPKKKRGRKPNSEAVLKAPRKRIQRPKKRKIHEIEEPLEDEKDENRRIRAIRAKLHRDKEKQKVQKLEQDICEVIHERDCYKSEVEILRKKNEELSQVLEDLKKKAQPLMTFFHN